MYNMCMHYRTIATARYHVRNIHTYIHTHTHTHTHTHGMCKCGRNLSLQSQTRRSKTLLVLHTMLTLSVFWVHGKHACTYHQKHAHLLRQKKQKRGACSRATLQRIHEQLVRLHAAYPRDGGGVGEGRHTTPLTEYQVESLLAARAQFPESKQCLSNAYFGMFFCQSGLCRLHAPCPTLPNMFKHKFGFLSQCQCGKHM